MTFGRHVMDFKSCLCRMQDCIVSPGYGILLAILSYQDLGGAETLTRSLPFGQYQFPIHRTGTSSRSTASRKREPLCLRRSHSPEVNPIIEGTASPSAASK